MGAQPFLNAEDERQYNKLTEKALSDKPDGFDLRTRILHPRSQEVLREQNYRLYIVGPDHTNLFERPVGSGNLWYKSGEPAGQLKMKDGKAIMKANGEIDWSAGAPHVAWTAPVSGDAKLVRDLTEAQAENERLKAELAAIESERKAKK